MVKNLLHAHHPDLEALKIKDLRCGTEGFTRLGCLKGFTKLQNLAVALELLVGMYLLPLFSTITNLRQILQVRAGSPALSNYCLQAYRRWCSSREGMGRGFLSILEHTLIVLNAKD